MNIRSTLLPLVSCASLLLAPLCGAETFQWSGAGGNARWDVAENWVGGIEPTDRVTTKIVVNDATSLASGYGLSLLKSKSVASLEADLSRFCLVAAGIRTFTLGSEEAPGVVHFGAKLSHSGVAFTTTNMKHRFYVEGINALHFRNDGSGEAQFGNAHVQNSNRGSGAAIIVFEGKGNWAFMKNSFLGRQTKETGYFDVSHPVDIVLSDKAPAFSGVVRYLADRPLLARNIDIASGTLRLEGGAIELEQGGVVTVGSGARLAGSGLVGGGVVVSGELDAGYDANAARLQVASLELAGTAHVTLRVFSTNTADSVSVSGEGSVLKMAGTLEVQPLYQPSAPAKWDLLSGFSKRDGDFSNVTLRGKAFTKIEPKVWELQDGNRLWRFDAVSGSLSVGVR